MEHTLHHLFDEINKVKCNNLVERELRYELKKALEEIDKLKEELTYKSPNRDVDVDIPF